MKESNQYVIMTGTMFLVNAATIRVSSEYPDALKYTRLPDALKDFRKADRKGFKLRIVQSYGTTDEKIVWQ